MANSYRSEEEMKKGQGGHYEEPAVGIPFGYTPSAPPQSVGGGPFGYNSTPPQQSSGGYDYMYAAQQGQSMMQAPVQLQPGEYGYHSNTNFPMGQPEHPTMYAPSQQQPAQYAYQTNANQYQPQQGPPMVQAAPQQQHVQYAYHPNFHPHQAGMVPPNAIFGPPNGLPLRETFFADTPAPFECAHCGKSGLTEVRSSPSFAALVACMMSIVGVCFLCKSCDCLWHKEHYCQNCGQKVANFKKSDPCIVMDPPQWQQMSYAVPA